MLYSVLKSIATFFLKVFFRLQVFGRENIPCQGGFILASNHSSYLDPVAVGVASSRKLNFLAKQELFSRPLFSWVLRHVGAFPIKRDSADLSALKEALRRIKSGQGLLVFPEASRSVNGISYEPQPGVGFLASKLSAPVVPAFVQGTEKVLPKYAKMLRFHKIRVYFGRQILLERRLPYADIAFRIMQEIRQLSCQAAD